MKIIKYADYTKQSWKNGKGMTREILRSPNEGDFNWRLSMADIVENGLFSYFPGIERTLILLTGAPIQIQHNVGPTHQLSLLTPYPFSGEWKTYVTIQSAGLDFNVMIRSDFGQSKVRVQKLLKGELKSLDGIIFVVKGEIKVKDAILQMHETLDCQSETVDIEALSDCEMIEINIFCNARD